MNGFFGLPAKHALALTMAVSVALGLGCRKQPKLVPVEGIVLIGGEPAANISVQFLPDAVGGEPRPTSFATTEQDGRFSLLAPEGKQGAVVGEHSVILADCDEERPAQGTPLKKPPRLDGKYSTLAGRLRATVTENGQPIEIVVPESVK